MAAGRGNRFEWDLDNIGHVGRHDVSREEFEQAMRNSPICTGSEMDERSGEERHVEIGRARADRGLDAEGRTP